MMSTLETFASRVVRAWVRLYTSGMPTEERDVRRAAIEADVWDQLEAARAGGISPLRSCGETVLRALLGAPDDILWRSEVSGERRGLHTQEGVTMDTWSKQTRWLGVCAAVAGALIAIEVAVGALFGPIGRVYTSETAWHLGGPVGTAMKIVGGITLVLALAGVVGLYLIHRKRSTRLASVGFAVLVAGFLATILGNVFASSDFLVNALVIPGSVVMIPVGFLLIGLGMPSPVRRVPLALGVFLVVKSALSFIGIALVGRFPGARMLYHVDSAFTSLSQILFGLALAYIGYTVWTARNRITSAV